ncbi:MAG: TetR/AcrR family transcriptional regulator [Thermodesulfobacteriota bacterium]
MAKNKNNNGKFSAILEAGIKIFAQQGYFQSTVAQIAREAGVADGTIYLYFKNKEDILATFVRQQTQEFFEAYRKKVAEVKHAVEKLRLLIRLHFEISQRDRNRALVYQVEMRRSDRLMKEDIRDALKTYHDVVGQIVEEGQQEGAIRHDLQPGMVKRMIFASVDEVITTWVLGGGKYDLVSLADPLSDLFLRGIAADRPR